MKITFLIANLYGIGGTIRSTANLSRALADLGHEVRVVSVLRTLDAPPLAFDPRVRLAHLVDLRKGRLSYEGKNPLHARPSAVYPTSDPAHKLFSELTDRRLADFLGNPRADVVIGTRPGLNVHLDHHGHAGYLRVGQEHVTHDLHNPALRAAQNAALAHLDAFVTVSEGDAAVYRRSLPELAGRIHCVPNGVPRTALVPAPTDSRTVVAAGRLIPVKRYDLLVDAFAKVVAERPDWRLRLYGRGRTREKLLARIEELGLHNHVHLMGAVSPIEPEWAKGSIAAVTSDVESFGMTIVEAMHCGVPVVATDCPFGPAEIIDNGVDGLLVERRNAEAIAGGLLTLINDRELRERMGRAATAKARTFSPEAAAARYVGLFEELGVERRVPRARRVLDALTPSAAKKSRPSGAGTVPARRRRPPADCLVADNGDLTVRLDPEAVPRGGAILHCRLRTDHSRFVRLPVPPPAPAPGTGHRPLVEVRVPRADHRLDEGRWDLFLETSGGRKRRVAAGLCDNRALLLDIPQPHATVRSWVPYTTVEGNLSLRTWDRATHAETLAVEVDEKEITCEARLHGASLISADRGACRVLAVCRTDAALTASVPVEPLPSGAVRFALPHAALSCPPGTGKAVFDLWLEPGGEAGGEAAGKAVRVRLGRVLDDIVERGKTHLYPTADHCGLLVRPYYTVNNNLSVSVRRAT